MTAGAPWEAQSLGSGVFRFINRSGRKLVMVVLSPFDGTEVVVNNGVSEDPHAVPRPVEAGASFEAVIRGAGVRVTATAPPEMTDVYWDFEVS